MKATVWANILEEGQENILSDQKTTQKTTQKISDIQTRIVDYLRHNPRANRGAITTYIKDITEDGIKYHLKVLQEKGIIKRIGPAKGGYWEVLSEDKK